jgi:putative ABC transport system ATP-binding protein
MSVHFNTTTEARSRSGVAALVVDATMVHGKGAAEVRALDGDTLDFAAGQFRAIIGPSGSGKSTLIHCVAGLDTLASGQAFVGGST